MSPLAHPGLCSSSGDVRRKSEVADHSHRPPDDAYFRSIAVDDDSCIGHKAPARPNNNPEIRSRGEEVGYGNHEQRPEKTNIAIKEQR